MKQIAIIGGGSAGLFLASIYNKEKTKITIFEKNNKIGKKLLTTGNGRCNLSNENISAKRYNKPDFVENAINELSPQKLKAIYKNMGLLTKTDSEGRIYPLCDSAATVLDLLYNRIMQNNVEIKTFCEIEKVIPQGSKFLLKCNDNNNYCFDTVVIASGGKTDILWDTKHTVKKFSPILCPLKTELAYFKKLSGTRVSANITVLKNNKPIFSEKGELMFRDYGISGIVVFNASRFYSDNTVCEIDILPMYTDYELLDILYKRQKQNNLGNILTGIFNTKLAEEIYKFSKKKTPEEFTDIIKHTKVKLLGIGDEKQAQVTRGGINTDEIDSATMQSNYYPNLFIIGEALDIDGECGGFNLHWAFSSAYIAAQNI